MTKVNEDKTIVGILRNIKYVFLKRHAYGLTNTIRVLPDFFVIGVVRSGTTSMYHYLDQHPSIVKSAYDEIGFFDDNFRLGWSWYRSLFPTRMKKEKIKEETGNFLTFDDTPFYIYNEIVAKRIREFFPNGKIIVLLRNPIDRAYSNYILGVRRGDEKRSFEEAVLEEMEHIKQYSEIQIDEFLSQSYLGRGLYALQLEIWFRYFKRENILIIKSEDFSKNTQRTMEQVFRFLDLPNFKIKKLKKLSNVWEYPNMEKKTRDLLREFFRPYNEKLYDMLKIDYNWV